MQDSNFREVRRVTNLLLKIKRHQRKREALEQDDEQHGISADWPAGRRLEKNAETSLYRPDSERQKISQFAIMC